MLQVVGHRRHFPLMYVRCGTCSESVSICFRLFYYQFFMALNLTFMVNEGCAVGLQTNCLWFNFGKSTEAKFLWQCIIYATIWCIGLEWKSSIFYEVSLTPHLIWDKIRWLGST